MRGNTFGKLFSLTSFGESHGPFMGVVLDGVPAGLKVDTKALQEELDKRRPGRLQGTTERDEKDLCEIVSGIFEEKTLGSPICVLVKNTNQKSHDYHSFKNELRKGHSDQTTLDKFGIRDHRGGGRSSGRETLARVIAGYFASLILPSQLQVFSYISKLGPFETDTPPKALNAYSLDNQIDSQKISDYLNALKKEGDSIGGIISTRITNCPKALGEPCFDKLKADLSKGMLSIGACTGFLLGDSLNLSTFLGSEVVQKENPYGGIIGGISNGDEIIFQTLFKPTSTIGEKAKLGRHDPCILPRAIHVVNAMTKIILADHFLRQNAYQIGTKDC